jgi:hypothetical protein
VTVAGQPLGVCRVPHCGRPALRIGGQCSWHAQRKQVLEPAQVELLFPEEGERERRQRRAILAATDRLLSACERLADAKGADALVPPRLVELYAAMGGCTVWGDAWPTAVDLHEALLAIQEGLVRRPVLGAALTPSVRVEIHR